MNKDRWRLLHIQDAIERIESYVIDGEEAFFAETMIQDAEIRQIEIVGEAAKNLSNETKGLCPEIPWREIAGTRNVLAHEYFDVVAKRIWRVVEKDLPPLKQAVSELLARPEIS